MDLPPLSRHRDVLILLDQEWRAWDLRCDWLQDAYVRGGLPQPRFPRPGPLLASTEDCSPEQTSKQPMPSEAERGWAPHMPGSRSADPKAGQRGTG